MITDKWSVDTPTNDHALGHTDKYTVHAKAQESTPPRVQSRAGRIEIMSRLNTNIAEKNQQLCRAFEPFFDARFAYGSLS